MYFVGADWHCLDAQRVLNPHQNREAKRTMKINSQHVARVGQVLDLMRTDTAIDAPRDVLAYAVNIFSGRQASRVSSLMRRIVATLSFDSSANLAPAFGVRSGQA